jgi:hypothetical protein
MTQKSLLEAVELALAILRRLKGDNPGDEQARKLAVQELTTLLANQAPMSEPRLF